MTRITKREARALTLTRKATRRTKYATRPLSPELFAGVAR